MCKTRPAGQVRPATRFCPAREMFLNNLEEGLSTSFDASKRNIVVIDDLMAETDERVTNLFTKKSHHCNTSVMYLVQNLFPKNKEEEEEETLFDPKCTILHISGAKLDIKQCTHLFTYICKYMHIHLYIYIHHQYKNNIILIKGESHHQFELTVHSGVQESARCAANDYIGQTDVPRSSQVCLGGVRRCDVHSLRVHFGRSETGHPRGSTLA